MSKAIGIAVKVLAEQWRQRAIASREEADRIRLTVKAATTAEDRCYVRAEIWDECADALEKLARGGAA